MEPSADPSSTNGVTHAEAIYRMVVAFLGLTMLVTVIGVIVLTAMGKSPDEGLVALGSAAVGGLAGFLAPSPALGKPLQG